MSIEIQGDQFAVCKEIKGSRDSEQGRQSWQSQRNMTKLLPGRGLSKNWPCRVGVMYRVLLHLEWAPLGQPRPQDIGFWISFQKWKTSLSSSDPDSVTRGRWYHGSVTHNKQASWMFSCVDLAPWDRNESQVCLLFILIVSLITNDV